MVVALDQQDCQVILVSVDHFDPFQLLYLVLRSVSFSPLRNLLGLQIKHYILLAVTDCQVSFTS